VPGAILQFRMSSRSVSYARSLASTGPGYARGTVLYTEVVVFGTSETFQGCFVSR
jgi:hypothetical protein